MKTFTTNQFGGPSKFVHQDPDSQKLHQVIDVCD